MSDNSWLTYLIYLVSHLPLWKIVGGVENYNKMTITFPNQKCI